MTDQSDAGSVGTSHDGPIGVVVIVARLDESHLLRHVVNVPGGLRGHVHRVRAHLREIPHRHATLIKHRL
eukprot:6432048-Pyramimonas_sp.AAC.1